MRGNVLPTIVKSETRTISENEMMLYTEYDNGVATVAWGYVEGKDSEFVSDDGSSIVISMDAWLHHSLCDDLLIVNDIELLINYNFDYDDEIIDRGEVNSTAGCAYGDYSLEEDGDSPAYAEYIGWFYFDLSDISDSFMLPYADTQTLRIELLNNSWTLSSY